MNYTSQKGLLTEIQCQQDFTKYGILLSQPIITDSRYDYLADIDGKIYKIQCKSSIASTDKQSIMFACSNRNWNNGQRKDYKGQVDFFYTCYNNQGYLIKPEETGKRTKTLRFKTNENNINNSNISWAEDYKFENIISSLLKEDINKSIFIPQEQKQITNFCIDCGATISKKAIRCRHCAGKKSSMDKTNDIISREELKEMIRKLPFTEIGKRFDVSDNAIRKWCDKYNLPRHKKEINNITDEDWEKI